MLTKLSFMGSHMGPKGKQITPTPSSLTHMQFKTVKKMPQMDGSKEKDPFFTFPPRSKIVWVNQNIFKNSGPGPCLDIGAPDC